MTTPPISDHSKVRPRVLIVEDEVIVARDISQQLVELDYEPVGICVNGEAAVTMAGEKRPNLVLMDIHLVGAMDGIEAAQEIRRTLGLPVVFLTAYAEKETLDRAKLAEPFGYIIKPFDDRELHSTVEMALFKHAADTRLKESETRFRKIFEEAPLGIAMTDLSTGRFISANSAFCTMLGYTEEELRQKTFVEVTHPEHRAADAEAVGKLLTGVVQTAHTEKRYLTKRGNVLWTERALTKISGYQGDSPCALTMVKDISERKRADEEVRKQAEALKENNAELMRFNRASVGRELRMVELKQQINALCSKLGQPPSYPRVDPNEKLPDWTEGDKTKETTHG